MTRRSATAATAVADRGVRRADRRARSGCRYVALGPGPTFDTLGEVEGTTVVAINGQPTYPTSGNLNMTTVGLSDNLTVFDALGLWASGSRQLVPARGGVPAGQDRG